MKLKKKLNLKFKKAKKKKKLFQITVLRKNDFPP